MVKIAITKKPRKEAISLIKYTISIVKYEPNLKDMMKSLREILNQLNHNFIIERFEDTHYYRIYHDKTLTDLTIDAYHVHKNEVMTEIGIKFQKIINRGILNEKEFKQREIEKNNKQCREKISEIYRISKMSKEEIKNKVNLYSDWFIQGCKELRNI